MAVQAKKTIHRKTCSISCRQRHKINYDSHCATRWSSRFYLFFCVFPAYFSTVLADSDIITRPIIKQSVPSPVERILNSRAVSNSINIANEATNQETVTILPTRSLQCTCYLLPYLLIHPNKPGRGTETWILLCPWLQACTILMS
ncbi:uncharacterized protein LOC144351334 [Saccoglossus kowalevskii]